MMFFVLVFLLLAWDIFHTFFYCFYCYLEQINVSEVTALLLSNLLFYVLFLSWRSSYHIETSPLICRANQWTFFYIKGTSIIKQLTSEHNFAPNFLFLTANTLPHPRFSLISLRKNARSNQNVHCQSWF